MKLEDKMALKADMQDQALLHRPGMKDDLGAETDRRVC